MRKAVAEDEEVRLEVWSQGSGAPEESLHRGVDVPEAFNVGSGLLKSHRVPPLTARPYEVPAVVRIATVRCPPGA